MPSLVIDDRKTEFLYTDSGHPGKEVYTTLVIIHGHTFHSGTFQRINSLASSRGFRIVCLHRRDYPGSTLYGPSELRVLAEGTETERDAFMKSRGLEISQFLNGLIDELALPAPTPEGNDGGLALLGWSLGNVFSLAAIAAADSLPADVHLRTQSYLRKLIMLEPPALVFGIPDPPTSYSPVRDESISEDQRGAAFAKWVSAYYKHGDLSTRDINVLNDREPDPSRMPSIANMSPEEFGSMVDFAPGPRSEVFLLNRFGDTFTQQTKKALFNHATRSLWPKMDIWLVYGDSPSWNVIYAAWELEKQAKAFGENSVKFSMIKGANHFVFWDEPGRAMDALTTYLRT